MQGIRRVRSFRIGPERLADRRLVGNLEQKSQVITTSSIAGSNRTPTAGYAYGQSKAATTHLMKMLATNLVPYGIRSNAIAPGCKLSALPDHLTRPL